MIGAGPRPVPLLAMSDPQSDLWAEQAVAADRAGLTACPGATHGRPGGGTMVFGRRGEECEVTVPPIHIAQAKRNPPCALPGCCFWPPFSSPRSKLPPLKHRRSQPS